MGGWVDRFGAILLDASVAVAVVLSLVALAMLACRQPGRRVALARAGVVASLLIFPLVALKPLPRVAVREILRLSPLGVSPLLSGGVTTSHPVGVARARGREALGGAGQGAAPQAGGLGVARLVVLVYLVGAALRLGWLVLGYAGLCCVVRRSLPPPPEAASLYESLRRRDCSPTLRMSQRVRRPVVVGLFRQTILIPMPLGRPEATNQLRLSLLHELAHADARDSAFGLISGLAESLWFFLPPLWWVRAQMRLDQEFLADRRAAGEFGPSPAYASSLVNLAGSGEYHVMPSPPVAPRAETGGSALFQRVLMLVHCPFPIESRPPSWWRWSMPVLVLTGTLAASTVTVRSSGESGAGESGAPPAVSGTAPRRFRMTQLVVSPRTAESQGRTSILEVPIRMPETFELDVDAWGTPDTLAASRIAGRNLGDPEQPTQSPPAAEQWHRVRVRRDEQGQLAVWLDGHLLAPPSRASTTRWLTFESPANHITHYRNLTLTW